MYPKTWQFQFDFVGVSFGFYFSHVTFVVRTPLAPIFFALSSLLFIFVREIYNPNSLEQSRGIYNRKKKKKYNKYSVYFSTKKFTWHNDDLKMKQGTWQLLLSLLTDWCYFLKCAPSPRVDPYSTYFSFFFFFFVVGSVTFSRSPRSPGTVAW